MTDAPWLTHGRLRARRDLTIVEGDDTAVVKDPLSLEYFRLGDRERFLLETLREPMTVAELTRRFQRRFPNERATGAHVLAFCSSLHDCALVLSDRPVDDATRERRRAKGKTWWASLLSPLAVRLPGVDPTPLLRLLGPLGGVLLSPAFAALLGIAAVAVAAGLLGRAEEVARELSQLLNLFDPTYAAAAILAVVLAKGWHELGHALACRRMGAECHEIGVLLLALVPCLYCDVSDAWTLRGRWRRAVVAMAGVYFEAVLAVAAAAAWLVLAPGPARTLALYVVVASTVSTLLVNLNPLLRFDGYYLLADLWGVANLHEQSRAALWGPLRRWVRADRSPPEPRDAPTWMLAVYGAASTVYGWAILALILWAAYKALDGAGFAAAGDLLVTLTLTGIVVGIARAGGTLTPRGPGTGRSRAWLRLAIAVVVAVAAGFAVAQWPLEQTLHSRCRIESGSFADVVARSDGALTAHVSHGDVVDAGDLLAELIDPEAELRRLTLLEREATLEAELAGLRTRSQSDPALLAEIAQAEPLLAEVRRQLRTDTDQTERRRLRAPIAGRVDQAAERSAPPQEETADGELPTWYGSPLDPANAGCWVESGDPVCRLTGGGVEAVLLLGEDDSGLVRVGDEVRIALDRTPGEPLAGRVLAVAQSAADDRVTEAERRAEDALREPLRQGAVYRVRVELTEAPAPDLQPGAVGQARVVTGRETVGAALQRRLRRLMRWG